MDPFTSEFKRLKARRPPPDFSNVIDFDDIEKSKHLIERIKLPKTNVKPVLGFKPCEDWNVFRFPEFPGYIVIQNPFYDGYQRYWVSRCLQDFSADKRNSSNLTNLGHFDLYDVWEDFVSRKCTIFDKDDPLRKLRWVTLGYHYGWDVKEYSEDRKAEFPADVQCLSQYFSHCLGFGAFRAEAGIVNYYHLDSTLGGHTDHSEIDHTAPLLSFSFGQSCVFLLGGPTKETKPMALFLKSGDVCIMSEEARLAYHAVPKIVSPENNSLPSCFYFCEKNGEKTTNGKCQNSKQNGSSVNDKSESSEHYETKSCETDSNSNKSNDTHRQESDSDALYSSRCVDVITYSLQPCGKANTNTMSNEYLSYIGSLNENIEKVISNLEWKPYETFLQHARINLNLRQVLPPECSVVEPQMEKKTM